MKKEFPRLARKSKNDKAELKFYADKIFQGFRVTTNALYSRRILREAVAIFTIFVVLFSAYFQNSKYSQGATYVWTQTNWATQTANATGHPAPADWTEYSAKDANVSAVNGNADLQLTPKGGSANVDFNTAGDYTQQDATGGTLIQGGAGSIMSSGGATWTQRALPVSATWASVVYGNGTFVAVAGGPSNIVATSTDGITWTQRTMPSSSAWTSVTYGNGVFVAVATGATVAATSPDGITWTARTLPYNGAWSNVIFGNGIFLAVTSNVAGAATSSDGITWTARTPSLTVATMTYGNGVFVIIATNSTSAATSPDGITWTARTLPANASWKAVTYGNGVFVAVAYNGAVAATSTDGITWTQRTLPVTANWYRMAYGNGTFVAVATSSNIAATSPDGITWTQRTMSSSSAWNSVTYGNGTFVAVVSGSSIAATSLAGNPTAKSYYITTATVSQVSTATYAHITGITLTQTTPANTSLKYLASFDNRATWKYWDGAAWQTTTLSNANLQSYGMDKTALEAISQAQWEASGGFVSGTGTLDFAVDLKTTDTAVTPSLDNIQVNYVYYQTGDHTLTFSKYDSGTSSNTMSKIQWTENISAGVTDAKFQVRTAASAGGLDTAPWYGPDGTSVTYFTDPAGGEVMPTIFTSGGDDRYFQYKAYLSTADQSVTPTISDVTVSYSVNAPPAFDATFGTNGVTAAQISNSADVNWGKVKIDFAIKDEDTTSGSFTPNYVTPTFEYTLNGTTWSEVTSGNIIFDTAPVGGDYGTYAGNTTAKVLEGSYLTYTAFWDAKTQIPETFSNTFQIRVKVNDNEGANNLATAIGNTTTLDTKNPTMGAHPILVNGSVGSGNITLSATDDSTLKTNINLDNSFAAVLTDDYAATKTVALAGDPDTVYAKYQDIYGNTSNVSSATTAQTPTAMMVQDTTNMTTNPIEYRLFAAWEINNDATFASYKIYRSTDETNWTLMRTETDHTVNYFGDSSMSNDTQYYYKVVTTDTDGNVSFDSATVNGKANGIQDAGEGGGGSSPSTAPVISNVLVSGQTSTSAIVTWDTDTLANSIVEYSTTAGDWTNASSKGSASMVNNSSGVGIHSVALTGLTPNEHYFVRVKSIDATDQVSTNNNGGPGHALDTLAGPAITNVSAVSVSDTEERITWTTNVNASELVAYSTAPSMAGAVEVGDSNASRQSHTVDLAGLTPDILHYITVKSTDGNGATTTANSQFTPAGTPDTTDPGYSNITESLVTDAEAAITWKTDEAATSQISYKKSSAGPWTTTTEISDLDINHYVMLNNLEADTDYDYKVISKDVAGNGTPSGTNTFKTAKVAGLDHAPLSSITNVTNALITDIKAVVTFDTDQAALCLIQSGNASGNYTNDVAKEDGYDAKTKFNLHHSIHLNGLIFSTKYYYKISCVDNLDTAIESIEHDVTTTEQLYTSSGVDALGDHTAPQIVNVKAGAITGESVTVTWDTDEKSNSLVKYGITSGTYENVAGNGEILNDTANFLATHLVIINGLVPSTKYYFTVLSYDVSGNVAESSESSFTTASPSSLSSIKVTSLNLNEATITWTTSEKATSLVEYGLTTAYGDKKESTTMTTAHAVTISGFESGQTYHFRVKGKDANNNLYSSGDYTFEPKSPPQITGSRISEVTEHGAKIVFNTNVPTDGLVSFNDAKNPENSGSQGNPQLTSAHEIVLKNLPSGVAFTTALKVRDEQGNETTQAGPSFTTGKDEQAPKIDQVKTDSALAQNNKVQSIISWITDEPGTTSLLYREGRSGEEKETKISEQKTNSHIAVVTVFKPGTVYYFKVKSVDESGNAATSTDYALLTPRNKENIIQIITKNFQDIFSWAKL